MWTFLLWFHVLLSEDCLCADVHERLLEGKWNMVWVSDCWSRRNIWQKLLKGLNRPSHSEGVPCLVLDWQLIVSPRWCPAHPDGAAPLQGGAAAGDGHAGVPGRQGLPLRLESGLEGGRQQQQLGGEQEPRGAGGGRPLQLEQHPEAPCRPVGQGGLRDLWGHPGLPDCALRDAEERPVFPVSWATGALILVHSHTGSVCL